MKQASAQPGAIEVESLYTVYRASEGRTVEAVQGLNLSVPAGQIRGLAGPNGAGKTTVLRSIVGLVQPTSGSIRLNGYDLFEERERALQQAGVVVEGHPGLQESLSVQQNLVRGGGNGSSGRQVQTNTGRLLHQLNLWRRRGESPSQLSAGVRRLAALACAFVGEPPVLLLDEPFQHLDAQMTVEVEALIRQHARENDAAVLLTTRQPAVAKALCDEVAVMRHGRLVADQPLADLPDLVAGEYYQIRVKGRLEAHRSTWFEDLSSTTVGDETILSGVVADQAALQGVIGKVRDLGIPLLSVAQVDPGPEQALSHLMYAPFVELEQNNPHLEQREALV